MTPAEAQRILVLSRWIRAETTRVRPGELIRARHAADPVLHDLLTCATAEQYRDTMAAAESLARASASRAER